MRIPFPNDITLAVVSTDENKPRSFSNTLQRTCRDCPLLLNGLFDLQGELPYCTDENRNSSGFTDYIGDLIFCMIFAENYVKNITLVSYHTGLCPSQPRVTCFGEVVLNYTNRSRGFQCLANQPSELVVGINSGRYRSGRPPNHSRNVFLWEMARIELQDLR